MRRGWYLGLDLELDADLEARRTPGGEHMASPTTLHIGGPCRMRCTPCTL